MSIKLLLSFRKGSCLNLWSSLNHWTFNIVWRKDKYEPIIMVLLICELNMTQSLVIFLFFKLFPNEWDEPLLRKLTNLFCARSHPGLSHHANIRSPKQENKLTGDFGPFTQVIGWLDILRAVYVWTDHNRTHFKNVKICFLAFAKYQKNVKFKVHDQTLLL